MCHSVNCCHNLTANLGSKTSNSSVSSSDTALLTMIHQVLMIVPMSVSGRQDEQR
jgi:hypothetical protein